MSKGWASFLTFVLMFPAAIWSSYVARLLWSWFAVPLGAPLPSIVQMMGLGIIVGMFRYHPRTDSKEDEKRTGEDIFVEFFWRAALAPAICLFFGWLCTKFL